MTLDDDDDCPFALHDAVLDLRRVNLHAKIRRWLDDPNRTISAETRDLAGFLLRSLTPISTEAPDDAAPRASERPPRQPGPPPA